MSAYLIAEVEVTDPEAYKAYMARTPAAIHKHGGRFIVRGGGNAVSLEGTKVAGPPSVLGNEPSQ